MLRKILDVFGLALASDYDAAMHAIDNAGIVSKTLATDLSQAKTKLAEAEHALALSRRESASHARTAQHYRDIAVNHNLDVGAGVVGVLGPCGGKFSHYMLQLGIKANGEYTAIEVRTLAASNKNRAILEEIAGKINAASEIKKKLESLLRPATAAPVGGNIANHTVNGMPKGFA